MGFCAPVGNRRNAPRLLRSRGGLPTRRRLYQPAPLLCRTSETCKLSGIVALVPAAPRLISALVSKSAPHHPIPPHPIFTKSSRVFYDFFRASPIRSNIGARNNVPLAFERIAKPTPPAEPSGPRLNIAVIFTSVGATLAALKQAAAMANRLSARITLLVPQIVPYPLPLTTPPVLVDWNERRFHVIADESPVETTVLLYLCRDRLETLSAVLTPRSLVIVGGRKRRWWPTPERRLTQQLRRAGHEVILTQTE